MIEELTRSLEKILARAKVRDAWADDAPLVVWPELVRAGFTSMTAPEKWGGLAMDAPEWVLVAEACGRAALAEPLVEHVAVCVPLIADSGDDAFCDRWLGGGRAVIACALGGAPYVPDADRADLILIEREGAVHAIEKRNATLTPVRTTDGARKLARVEGQGTMLRADLPLAFDRGAVAAAAQLIGLGRHLVETTVEYVKIRQQFGRAIGSFQAVKHHLAEAHVALELARPCVIEAARELSSVNASVAKARASEAAALAAKAALQCHGAIGYSFEHDLHLWMKRVWALAAAWGDAHWHTSRLATHLLGDVHA